MTTNEPAPEGEPTAYTPSETGSLADVPGVVRTPPWVWYGGSFIWQGTDRASLPGRCCDNMDPELVGDCGNGCCDDYKCRSCGKRWRYEWAD